MHMNCYSGHHSILGTAKDERDNQVTAHEPAGKVKVSFLHNKVDATDAEDAADAEDAVDVEQNAETKIIKRKWRDATKFCTEESDATPAKKLDTTQTNVLHQGRVFLIRCWWHKCPVAPMYL